MVPPQTETCGMISDYKSYPNTTKLTDGETETCEEINQTTSNTFIMTLQDNLRFPVFSMMSSINCSPQDGALVMMFRNCPDGATCSGKFCDPEVATPADTFSSLYICNFYCGFHSGFSLNDYLKIKFSGDAKVCEFRII